MLSVLYERITKKSWLTILQQGILNPVFYGDLVYKFKRIVGKPNFSDLFKNVIKRYTCKTLDITRISCGSLYVWS